MRQPVLSMLDQTSLHVVSAQVCEIFLELDQRPPDADLEQSHTEGVDVVEDTKGFFGWAPATWRAAIGRTDEDIASSIESTFGSTIYLEYGWSDGRTALNLLTENKLKYDPDDIIEMLLATGADINHKSSKGGKNLLHFAARDNIVWIADRVLNLGVDIKSRTTYGETPLHCAAYYGGFDVGCLLLSKNADTETVHDYGTINSRDWNGLTPLAWAAVGFRRAFIEMLLRYGTSVMARPSTRSTVLHLAVGETDTRLLEMLLDMQVFQSADVLNAKDSAHDATALHYCVGNIGKEAHSQLLIEASADVNAVTSEGFSVLDLACGARAWMHDNPGAFLARGNAEAYYSGGATVTSQ